MQPDLIGYLFGILDPDDRSRVEGILRDDPVARRRLSRLRASLAPLESLRLDDPLPPGLAERTVAYVLSRTAVPPGRRPTPARLIPVGDDQPVFQPSRWRRMDVLVAACILVVVGGLGIAGVGRLQQRREVAACQNNMRQAHLALANYSDQHEGNFPMIQEQGPYNTAGAFAALLQQAGTTPVGGVPDCPAIVVVRSGDEPPVGYAYTLGFRDAQGHLHGLRSDLLPGGSDLLPILADRPNPVGHRTGYNVLYIGGHVRFCTSPNVGVDGDDIFVNHLFKIAAGMDRIDTVLADWNIGP